MLLIFGTIGVVLFNILINVTANHIPPRIAKPLLKWGWFGSLLYFTGLVMSIEPVQEWLRKIASPRWSSYVIVAILGAALAVAYWGIINAAASRVAQQDNVTSEPNQPTKPPAILQDDRPVAASPSLPPSEAKPSESLKSSPRGSRRRELPPDDGEDILLGRRKPHSQ